jgi:hypothetical protein
VSLGHRLAALTVVTAATLVVSGCSILEGLGFGSSDEAVVEETITEVVEGIQDGTTDGTATPGESSGLAVPTCDSMFSTAQKATLQNAGRTNVGDTSEGDFGWGTTNKELVPVLRDVRRDLRISCTWYLPASESVSVTSVAIIGGDTETEVRGLLQATTATQQTIGGGALWTIDSTTSDESPEFIATESHFITEVPCPSSLADTRCAVWVTTNYAFGDAKTLTIDAATTLGIYTN